MIRDAETTKGILLHRSPRLCYAGDVIRVTGGIIVLTLLLVVHLVEEVRGDFRRRLPLGEMPLVLFVVINVLVYAFCAVMIWLALHENPAAIPMAWAFAIAMLVNGTGHLAIMVVRRAYFPGGITAPGILAVSVYVIAQLLSQ
jgi:hypothetical protein